SRVCPVTSRSGRNHRIDPRNRDRSPSSPLPSKAVIFPRVSPSRPFTSGSYWSVSRAWNRSDLSPSWGLWISAPMGARVSSLMGRETGLGDLPENCVAAVLVHLNPLEICRAARLCRTFRGAASADLVWETKLPRNYRYLLALVSDEKAVEQRSRLCKKEIYARLCRPNPFDGGTKVFVLWLDCTDNIQDFNAIDDFGYPILDLMRCMLICFMLLDCRDAYGTTLFDLWYQISPKSFFFSGLQEFWLEKSCGGLCMSIPSRALLITGIDDHRYWNYIPTEESRYHTYHLILNINDFCLSFSLK
ncbi:hypothetical protein BHE74_00008539, partial [Ensete ventricosum]